VRIELDGVGKRYGRIRALGGVTLTVPDGARVALVGPNGSGKTTLTRAIMGIIDHEGTVKLDGLDAYAHRVELARRLAYVPQVAPQMAATVGEIVRTVSDVRGLPAGTIAARAARLDLDLAPIARRPFRSLSGGMKQKLLIATAFASGASLYVLDEPTASLDARARGHFFEQFEEIARGATLLLCSHRLEEIRHLVDHVIALEDGRVVHHGPAHDYLAARAAAVLELTITGDDDAWLRAHGFARGAAGAWLRTVSGPAEKVALLAGAVEALGDRLVNVSVRDLDFVEVRRAA
jgi:ABC-2 type transport system ATP-binding protein